MQTVTDQELRIVSHKPLNGTTIVVTRAADTDDDLQRDLEARGALVLSAPMIEIVHGNRDTLDEAVQDLARGHYRGVMFTSGNAVRAIGEAFERKDIDPHVLAHVELVSCVGPATAAALRALCDIRPHLIPANASATGLAWAAPPGPGAVLLPRGDLASDTLPTVLRERDWDVTEVIAYRTLPSSIIPAEVADALEEGEISAVLFASSSAVRNWVDITGAAGTQVPAISIGPSTSETCRDFGVALRAEATHPSMAALIDATVEALSRRNPDTDR